MNPELNFSPELLETLRAQGLHNVVNQIEAKLGISLGAIDSVLNEFKTVTQDALKHKVRKLAVIEDPVLVYGETGTGKEIIARALGANRNTDAKDGKRVGQFVAINVAAIPKELVESTLFGYTKGSFTGAAIDKMGLIQHAGAGTLFLDEIGDLSFDLQAKFLRVLQDRKVRRVGSLDEEEVKCRFVCATHANIEQLVKDGKFRQDLYARLSTFVLTIPPLRERLQDIPAIMSALEPKFPTDKVDWSKQPLPLNVRSLIQMARRYAVLQELPQ